MKTYATLVLGCKVNDYEASYIEEQLNQDYRKVSFKEKADIYLIFTCAVTNVAEAKSRKYINQARRQNPEAYIAAIGCYVQSASEDVFSNVDLLVGTSDKSHIKDYIDKGYRGSIVKNLDDICFETMPINNYSRKDRAFLKIQDGCNQYCSFCIIPYARGKERSAKHEDLIKQAQQLARHSKEIVLTGIHTGRYDDGEYNLTHLLRDLCQIEGLERIRLSSIEVTELSDELLQLMSVETKIAPHLHIPLQSGSNRILKKMARPYTTQDFFKRCEDIRKLIPDILISTDLIVGYPTENEEDQLETLAFLKKMQFSFLHVFPYARKSGTAADREKDFINGNVVKGRIKQINDQQKDIRKNYLLKLVGKTLSVFVEEQDNENSKGYSAEYLPVVFKGECQRGNIVPVLIKGIIDENLFGEVICN